jgi:hypothetical protein
MTTFADRWKQASQDQDDFDPIDGSYTCKLIDATAFAARTDGREYVKLKWQIIGTDDAGRQFDDFQGISHPVGLRITREKLLVLGLPADLEAEDIDGLDHAIFNLIGVQAELTVGHKDGYRNVSVQSAITGDPDIPNDPPARASKAANGSSPRSFAAAAAGDDDEDIPF